VAHLPDITMESEIKRLCQIIVKVVNERDFEFMSSEARELIDEHVSPDWYAQFDNIAWTVNFAEQIEAWRQLRSEFPSLVLELVGFDCDMHKDHTNATVIMQTAMTGRKGVKLQGICQSRWRYRNGRWMWCYHTQMRGLYEA